MSAELWLASAQIEGDYRVTRVIIGEAEHLRPRLVEAVERMGYQVIYDQTAIVARRGARCMASSGCSLDITDYATELIISLKGKGSAATLATFNFTVKNYYYGTKGDRRTMAREADAIAALAVAQGSLAACTSCGTETTDDSRFCRRCGAPLALEEPAELEVLRLAAGSLAAQKNIVTGVVVLAAVFSVVFLLLWLGTTPKTQNLARWLALMGGVGGLITVLAGSWRLHRTLNPARDKKMADEIESATAPKTIGASRATAALPPRSAQASVTEGTTELLNTDPRERVPVEAHRERGDTGPIN